MKFSNRLSFFIIFILAATLTVAYFFPAQGSSVTLSAYIASICSNGAQELTEQCDGSDLNGQTCAGLGYDSGALSCSADCTFNASACATAPASSGGGGGGGGGGSYIPPATGVILQGKAYPSASLTILKDGQVIVVTKADSLSDFKITLTTLTAGSYTFGIWAEDRDGNKSVTFSITVTITSGTTTTISGIFIPPTIKLSSTSVSRGGTLNIAGQTAPESDIDVYVYSEEEIVKKTKSNQIGAWAYALDTGVLAEGSHTTKAKSVLSGLISTFSQTLSFYVGEGGVQAICGRGNLNGDGRVNLVDFSIMLYWWGKANDCADQNKNGVVDLADFSIMMYYWTG